jgi:hypothetical protein
MPPRAKTTKKKGSIAGKRYPLNMRTTFEMRQRLEAAAKDSGRSLAQEAEFRIDRTFQTQRLLAEALELAFGSRLAGLLLVIGDAAKATASTAGFINTGRVDADAWLQSPLVYDEVAKAISKIVEVFRPPGERPAAPPFKPQPGLPADLAKIMEQRAKGEFGEPYAEGRLALLRGDIEMSEESERLTEQRKLLGPLIERLQPK